MPSTTPKTTSRAGVLELVSDTQGIVSYNCRNRERTVKSNGEGEIIAPEQFRDCTEHRPNVRSVESVRGFVR